MRLSVRSVRLAVTRVDQSKTVEVRITQFSPSRNSDGILRAGVKQAKGGVGNKTSYFLALGLCVNISDTEKTVRDTSKVTILMTNRKLHALSIGTKVVDPG